MQKYIKSIKNLQVSIDDLTAKAALMQAENERKAQEIEALNNRLLALTAEAEQKTKAILDLETQITTITTADNLLVTQLKKDLEDEKSKLTGIINEKTALETQLNSRSAVIEETLQPLWGMYYSERKTFAFGSATCRLFVYVEPNGDMIQAVACDDGKLQWERRSIVSMGAAKDLALDGQIAFTTDTRLDDSSCKSTDSMFKGSSVFSFDRGARFGSSDLATGMSVTLNDKRLTLDSAALNFTNNECEDILQLARSPEGQLSQRKSTLEMMSRVCTLTAESQNVGCFTNSSFLSN